MPKVIVAEATEETLQDAIDAIFAPFGGVTALFPREGKLFIKPNGIHFAPYTHTAPQALAALLAYLRQHGYQRLFVMENCTHGNFTRLVFKVTGYDRICRRYGARPLYLDEGGTATVTLPGETKPVQIPRLIYDELIAHKENNRYLAFPKLKTHSMTTVTLGVKNQMGLLVQRDRMREHHFGLHERLTRIYRFIRPDFTLIEGLTATIHGHFPATANLDECLVRLNVLIGGRDTVAVDAVGARVLGYDPQEVEHLRLAAAAGLGCADLARIEVVGDLGRFQTRYPHTLLRRFPPGVTIVQGQERACIEGCRGNTECVLEMLGSDYAGHGGFSVVFGRGLPREELERLQGDILIVGPCAVAEAGEYVRSRYRQRRVYTINEHNDLRALTTYLTRLTGVKPLRMVPLNPVYAALLLGWARLHGLHARTPPLLG